ncbi:unnamed protein product [Caretta caretta]
MHNCNGEVGRREAGDCSSVEGTQAFSTQECTTNSQDSGFPTEDASKKANRTSEAHGSETIKKKRIYSTFAKESSSTRLLQNKFLFFFSFFTIDGKDSTVTHGVHHTLHWRGE